MTAIHIASVTMHTYDRLYENGFVNGHDFDNNLVDLTKNISKSAKRFYVTALDSKG